jgi:hypothetical protein
MTVNNLPKFIIILFALCGIIFLMSTSHLSPSEGMPIITAITFYGIGNGIASKRGQESEPVFSPKKEQND